jgi:hypothetical protein
MEGLGNIHMPGDYRQGLGIYKHLKDISDSIKFREYILTSELHKDYTWRLFL